MLLPARSLRLYVATAATALAVTVGLTACSSDDESDNKATTSSSAAATTSAAAHGDHPAGAAPSAEELQATLVLIADPAKPTAEKQKVVVNGEKRAANLDALNQMLAGYTLTFAVSDVKAEGNTATAQVVITSPHGAAPAMPLTWEHVDGVWKLSDASACTLLGFSPAPCTP